MPPYRFDVVTAVEPAADGRFKGRLDEAWSIASIPNGGYAMSMMLRAAQHVSNHPDPLSTTAHFLSPTTAGPVELGTEVAKPGRSSTTVMVTLSQEGRERIRMITTLGELGARQGPSLVLTPPPPLDDSLIEGRSDIMGGFPANFDLRLPAAVAEAINGNASGDLDMTGTIAFADGRPFDVVSLPTAADGFPPVVFNLGHIAWTPTLELTVHTWNRPAPGPLTVRVHSGAVQDGYHDESADIWDSTGALVARSRQLALIL